MDKICPICGSPLREDFTKPKEYMWRYDCYRCGKFKILEDGLMALNGLISGIELNAKTKIYISGWIREHQGSDIIIDAERLKSLMSLQELSVFEKADKILQYLAKKFPVAGATINYKFYKIGEILSLIEHQTYAKSIEDPSMKVFKENAPDLLPIVAIGRIIDVREFYYIWEDYLINEQHYISKESKITPAGWAYLETFRHPNPDSKKAFVAMWFDKKMEIIYDDHIKKAIEEAEYNPIQIGRKEHNNNINDEIIAEIRSSKFIIADFTGNRGGVYYEAGFAYGLKIEVIHTCRKDWWDNVVLRRVKAELRNKEKEIVKIKEKRKVHFDLNHHAFIIWKDGKDLHDKLLNRIKATIV